MKKLEKSQGKSTKMLMMVHMACCGGVLLFVLMGSAGFAAIGALASDPMVQLIALAGVASLSAWWWNRRRSRTARKIDGGRSPSTLRDV